MQSNVCFPDMTPSVALFALLHALAYSEDHGVPQRPDGAGIRRLAAGRLPRVPDDAGTAYEAGRVRCGVILVPALGLEPRSSCF